MVFVFIATGHAGSSARSFMLSCFLRLWVSDPVQSPVTKCPHLYLNCRRACPGPVRAVSAAGILVPGGPRALYTVVMIKSCLTDILPEFWRSRRVRPGYRKRLVLICLKALPGPARCSQVSVTGPARGP